jgi:hypothetical protein
MEKPVENIRILEVDDTNLLRVITNNEKDSTYYSKTNLKVSALNGKMVLNNEGVDVLSAFPYQVLEPKEESVVDLVDIIQGYIDNIIISPNETDELLKEILTVNEEANNILSSINNSNQLLYAIKKELKIISKTLIKIYQ